ncbi:MAG: histidine phosphatase family protein [Jaaginema sp. PMC 1079.18]|nr:histidine phosphatase family protein [Jaaginema sp. PMC 1080.18]MEC4853762.1 histidine phosphatase family protein [Jaaginema sp. PMC 1079.18]MEC4864918.1 histidine phosphatase family protein [Jaaginema sp. PMC 1078.18]
MNNTTSLPPNRNQQVWIARHGNRLDFVDPEWFSNAILPYDPPLSDDGIIQAQELAKRLENEAIAHIFVSPFLRTIQTAWEVAKVLNLPLKIEAGLGEWLNPDWMTHHPETLTKETLYSKYPCIDRKYQSCVVPKYPETETQMLARTATVVQQLVKEYPENILLIGHGASVLGATQGLLRSPISLQVTLCCLTQLIRTSEGWKLTLKGDTSHLSQPQQPIRWH